jgi:hypothetical protein
MIDASRAFSISGPALPEAPVERVCAFVIARVRAASGHRSDQGARKPPLACRPTSPFVRFFAEQRLHRVSTAVARALITWAEGFPVELLTSVPDPSHVLALQARGARCVSLVPEGVSTTPHADALAFVLHDLAHLDKFVDPAHHAGQVGFFASLRSATYAPEWRTFEASFDEAFRRDWCHVAADMNGSAVFLFAALKMKLKMAVRRLVARDKGVEPPHDGPLSAGEARAYDDKLDELLRLFRMGPSIADDARATSARRDDPGAAWRLLGHFEVIGQRVSAEHATHGGRTSD